MSEDSTIHSLCPSSLVFTHQLFSAQVPVILTIFSSRLTCAHTHIFLSILPLAKTRKATLSAHVKGCMRNFPFNLKTAICTSPFFQELGLDLTHKVCIWSPYWLISHAFSGTHYVDTERRRLKHNTKFDIYQKDDGEDAGDDNDSDCECNEDWDDSDTNDDGEDDRGKVDCLDSDWFAHCVIRWTQILANWDK